MMRSGIGWGLTWGWVMVGLCGALSAGCDDSDDKVDKTPAEPTDFELGTIAETRWDACHEEPWAPLSVSLSLSILKTMLPKNWSNSIDCMVKAKDCDQLHVCLHLIDIDLGKEGYPRCDSSAGGRCDGNVAVNCETSNEADYYELSYDCTLAGATCIEIDDDKGQHADCQAPLDPCEGHGTDNYCDGTRAVLCEETRDGHRSPAIFDCAEAWGSTCGKYNSTSTNVECEGPALGEVSCDDGKDNDGDGSADCDDSDCSCN
jgi:hypothetical protein